MLESVHALLRNSRHRKASTQLVVVSVVVKVVREVLLLYVMLVAVVAVLLLMTQAVVRWLEFLRPKTRNHQEPPDAPR